MDLFSPVFLFHFWFLKSDSASSSGQEGAMLYPGSCPRTLLRKMSRISSSPEWGWGGFLFFFSPGSRRDLNAAQNPDVRMEHRQGALGGAASSGSKTERKNKRLGGLRPKPREHRAPWASFSFSCPLFCHISVLRQSRWRWLVKGPAGAKTLGEGSSPARPGVTHSNHNEEFSGGPGGGRLPVLRQPGPRCGLVAAAPGGRARLEP